MIEETIITNNALIAEFMGYELDEDGCYLLPGNLSQFRGSDHAEWCSTKSITINWEDPSSIELYTSIGAYYWRISPYHLAYEGSWEWLMPVVNKCWKEQGRFGEGLGYFDTVTIFSPIEKVWGAVIEFVKYYNARPKTEDEDI